MIDLLVSISLAIPLATAYALFALGIVLIYRASRVLNLAHGAMAMLPAYVSYSLREIGTPTPLALIGGIAAGAALGAGVEVLFSRRLRRVSSTAQTVGTVAVFGLVVSVVAFVYGSGTLSTRPTFARGGIAYGGSGISYDQVGLTIVAVILTAALFALFQFTSLGLAMRGAADNRKAAALMGINPDRTTLAAWTMGGGLAAVAGILLSTATSLDPYVLSLQALPAFVAALIGGLESMPGALVGSLVVGVAIGAVPGLASIPGLKSFSGSVGAPQAVLAIIAFIVMARRGQKLVASNVRSEIL